MLRDSVVVVVVVRTRPRAIPLAMIAMRKSTHGFPFLSYMSMGLHLAAQRSSALKTVQTLPFTHAWLNGRSIDFNRPR